MGEPTCDTALLTHTVVTSSLASFSLVRRRAPGTGLSEVIGGTVSGLMLLMQRSRPIFDFDIVMVVVMILVSVKLAEAFVHMLLILALWHCLEIVIIGRIRRGERIIGSSEKRSMISSSLSILCPSVPVIMDIIHNGAGVCQCFPRNLQRNLIGQVGVQSVKRCVENLAAHVSGAASALEKGTELFDVGRSARRGVAADLFTKPNGTDGDDVEDRELADGSIDSLLKRVLTHGADSVEVPKAIASHGDLHVEEHPVVGVHREFGVPHRE